MEKTTLLSEEKIIDRIYIVRGKKVMLDRDLAEMYGVPTKVLNQAVKRNLRRFPDDFMFQMTEFELENWKSQFVTSNSNQQESNLKSQSVTSSSEDELPNLRSQNVTSNNEIDENNLMFQIGTSSSESKGQWGGIRKLPFVFTEQGVAMLSGVLNSDTAIDVNIQIIRVFTRMREIFLSQKELLLKIEQLEKNALQQNEFIGKHEKEIQLIFQALKRLLQTPKREIKKVGYKTKSQE